LDYVLEEKKYYEIQKEVKFSLNFLLISFLIKLNIMKILHKEEENMLLRLLEIE
jgi:hypothetical protein